MSARNCISAVTVPSQLPQTSQRPPRTLKEKRPTVTEAAALGVGLGGEGLRMSSKALIVAVSGGSSVGVRPMGDWSTRMTSLRWICVRRGFAEEMRRLWLGGDRVRDLAELAWAAQYRT